MSCSRDVACDGAGDRSFNLPCEVNGSYDRNMEDRKLEEALVGAWPRPWCDVDRGMDDRGMVFLQGGWGAITWARGWEREQEQNS